MSIQELVDRVVQALRGRTEEDQPARTQEPTYDFFERGRERAERSMSGAGFSAPEPQHRGDPQ
jgi:hypothetical protein